MKVTPEKAFKRATAGYELFGKKLLPFSAMRQGCAASMGMRFGFVNPDDMFTITVEEIKGKKKKSRDVQFYDQLFSDVIKVLWLCSVPDSRVLKAERRIDEAKAEAYKWADQNGIAMATETYFSAATVFFQIMRDVAAAEGSIVRRNGAQPDEEDDPNG